MTTPKPQRVYIHSDHITYSTYYVLDEEDDTIVALQMLGPEQAVKAAWAHLVSNGKQSTMIDKFSVTLEGSKMHVMMKAMLPDSNWLEMWLIHKQAIPNQISPSKTCFYLFQPQTGSHTLEQLYHQFQAPFLNLLDRVINTPVLPEWAQYLWQAGDNKGLISPPLAAERNVFAYRIKIDPDAWQEIITNGLRYGHITF